MLVEIPDLASIQLTSIYSGGMTASVLGLILAVNCQVLTIILIRVLCRRMLSLARHCGQNRAPGNILRPNARYNEASFRSELALKCHCSF